MAAPRPAVRGVSLVIVLVAVPLAIALVVWGDWWYARAGYLIWTGGIPDDTDLERLASWIGQYHRLQFDWLWLCIAATLITGAILSCDQRTWNRRRLPRPAAVFVLTVLVVCAVCSAEPLFAPPRLVRDLDRGSRLWLALQAQVPGAVMGAWITTLLPSRRGAKDWREHTARIVGWLWVVNVLLLIIDRVLVR